jgi:hypothetical protein
MTLTRRETLAGAAPLLQLVTAQWRPFDPHPARQTLSRSRSVLRQAEQGSRSGSDPEKSPMCSFSRRQHLPTRDPKVMPTSTPCWRQAGFKLRETTPICAIWTIMIMAGRCRRPTIR